MGRAIRLALAAALASFAAGPAMAQVKVVVIQGLSGPPAIVDFGESYLQGIKLALEDYKSKGGKTPIELVVYDDEANPQRAVSVVQRLIQNDGVAGVIGTVSMEAPQSPLGEAATVRRVKCVLYWSSRCAG